MKHPEEDNGNMIIVLRAVMWKVFGTRRQAFPIGGGCREAYPDSIGGKHLL